MRGLSVTRMNRALIGLIAVGAVGLGLALVQPESSAKEAAPFKPVIEDLVGPPAQILSPGLSSSQFQISIDSDGSDLTASAPLLVREIQWKLKGVMMGATQRAFLEDSEGKSLWVREGERLNSSTRVKEIRPRSVILEREGKDYEIQM